MAYLPLVEAYTNGIKVLIEVYGFDRSGGSHIDDFHDKREAPSFLFGLALLNPR